MFKYIIGGLVGGILAFPTGGLVGYLVGSTYSEDRTFNLALGDGKAILADVEQAGPTLRQVAAGLEQVSGDGAASGADVERLLAVPQPVDADLFRQRRYKAFRRETVDNLLRYYTGVLMIWDGLRGLGRLKETLESAEDGEREPARQQLSAAARRLLALTRQTIEVEAMLLPELRKIAAVPEH